MLNQYFAIFFICMYSLASLTMTDDRYQQAVDLRDGKIQDLSKKESSARAEQLFLVLAQEDNAKAMHNYAMIQLRKQNYDLAFLWFKKAGEAGIQASQNNAERMIEQGLIKKELHVVVGSTRSDGVKGRLVKAIYGNETDLSHLETFGGKTTTMDMLECDLKDASHIVADARTFDFSRYNVRSVLLEKLSTAVAEDTKQNYVGSIIENISNSMRPNSVIEIEWLPFSGMSDFSPDSLEAFIKSNPFNGFFNNVVVYQAISILAGNNQAIASLPKDLVKPTLNMVKKIRTLLEFYHEQGVGKSVEELIHTIAMETKVISEIKKRKLLMLLDYDANQQNADELKVALKKVKYGSFPPEYIGRSAEISDASNKTYKGIIYDHKFSINSFFNFMIQDLAADHNRPYVLSYLNSLGLFKNISIERGRNPYNGRNNVWMIRMTKRPHEEECHPPKEPKKYNAQFLQALESCRADKSLAVDGGDAIKEPDLSAFQVIQAGLGHKPVAFLLYEASVGLAGQIGNASGHSIYEQTRDALRFAEENGAIVQSYYDETGSEVKIVYRPEHERTANYFINKKRCPALNPKQEVDFVLEGILLGYNKKNIKQHLRSSITVKNKEKNPAKGWFDEYFETLFNEAQILATKISLP